MCKIIGGEFAIHPKGFETFDNTSYLQSIDYSSGRCGLYAILKDIESLRKKRGGILLPNYLCASITNTIIDAGWNYKFSDVSDDLQIETESIERILCNLDFNVILLINYFGMASLSEIVSHIRTCYTNIIIIVDSVQAFYNQRIEGADYNFTSLRKWFPCPDGAIVAKASGYPIKPVPLNENMWAQYKMAGNLLKSYSYYIDDRISLNLIERGEDLLDKNYLSVCSEASKKIMNFLNLEEIAEIRKKNAGVLHRELVQMGIRHLYSESEVPLFIPIFIDYRDTVQKYFYRNNIFTPKHWPYISENVNGINNLYSRELSLICDQRYDEEDMMRQIAVLKAAKKQMGEDRNGNFINTKVE